MFEILNKLRQAKELFDTLQQDVPDYLDRAADIVGKVEDSIRDVADFIRDDEKVKTRTTEDTAADEAAAQELKTGLLKLKGELIEGHAAKCKADAGDEKAQLNPVVLALILKAIDLALGWLQRRRDRQG